MVSTIDNRGHNTRCLTRWAQCWFSSSWWRILSPRRQPRRWLMAQPKGTAASILFPHLKMVPLPVVLSFWKGSTHKPTRNTYM